MNILISGIHGFVGSNLVAILKNQHSIYGLDIVSPQKEGVVKTYGWNDLKKIPPIDCVIHLAGKAHDTKNQTNAQFYFDINTGLTKQIFDWFLINDAKIFIFFSSVKAATDKVVGAILTEDVVPAPKGPYGESKLAAEQYIFAKANEGKMVKGQVGNGASELLVDRTNEIEYIDKKVYILRPCMIHGPGNRGNLNLLFKVVSKGIPWPLGSFDNKRSFTSINNLSFIVEKLINMDIESGIYHIGDDDPLSTNQLIGLISESVGKKSHIWNIPKGLINLFAKIGDKLHLPLNSFRLQKLTENYVVSNDKIKRAIGVNKLPDTASEGMIKTLTSFKNN